MINANEIYERFILGDEQPLNDLLNRANHVIEVVVGLLEDNAEIFEYQDLKLHTLAFRCSNDIVFNSFCEDSYDLFINNLAENYIDFDKTIKRLGRTSKFWLGKWFEQDYNNKFNIDRTVFKILQDTIGFFYLDIDNENKLIIDYNYIGDCIYELCLLVDDVLEYVQEKIKETRLIYDYIDIFKKNQISLFNEYCECCDYEQYIIKSDLI